MANWFEHPSHRMSLKSFETKNLIKTRRFNKEVWVRGIILIAEIYNGTSSLLDNYVITYELV